MKNFFSIRNNQYSKSNSMRRVHTQLEEEGEKRYFSKTISDRKEERMNGNKSLKETEETKRVRISS